MTFKIMTRDELRKPFALTCGTCGGTATAYPYPMPKGTVFCPTCSPAWLQSFLAFASKAA